LLPQRRIIFSFQFYPRSTCNVNWSWLNCNWLSILSKINSTSPSCGSYTTITFQFYPRSTELAPVRKKVEIRPLSILSKINIPIKTATPTPPNKYFQFYPRSTKKKNEIISILMSRFQFYPRSTPAPSRLKC